MTLPRSSLALVALALLALAGLAVATAHLVARDRAALLDRFAEDRQASLDEAGARVEEVLADLADDVAFADRLAAAADDEVERAELIGTLLASVRAYRGAFLLDGEGRILQEVADPRRPSADLRSVHPLATRAALEALAASTTRIEVSPAWVSPDDGTWLRAFALRSSGAGAHAAVALVADTGPLLTSLRLVTAEPDTHLLVVGPHGAAAPVSSPDLVVALQGGRLDPVLARARSAPRGSIRLAASEAVAAGLPRADALLTWRALALAEGDAWLALSLSSTQALRSHERALVRRTLGGSALAGLVVTGLLIWAGAEARKSAVLAERLDGAVALGQAHARARRTLEHVPSAVAVLGPELQVREVNPAFAQRFGTPPADTPLDRAFPGAGPEHLDLLVGLVERALAEGRPAGQEDARLRLGDAEGIWRAQAVPLPGDSEGAALLVLDDLGELLALRGRLIRAEKLATVGELAAGIAHEIGTPLGVIQGRAEYIRGKLGPEHPQAAGLDVIVEQIGRVARIIRSLLDFARQEGTSAASGQQAPLGPALRRLAELLTVPAEQAGVQLAVAQAEAGTVLRGDADTVDQVLLILAKNALDASSAGGRIEVRASPGDAFVRIEVVDQGHGIAPGDLHRVFDPFFTTRKRGQGTGLGLAVALRLVRSHGARLELDSAVGRGTRAILDWPRA